MRAGRITLTALSLLTISAIASCSSAVTGSANADRNHPSATSQPTETDRSSQDGSAPSVPAALNVKPYLGSDVCYIISKEQAHSIGFYKPHASPHQKAMGPTCGIGDHDSKHSTPDDLSIGFQPRFSLDDIYKRKSDWAYFIPGEVQNYPYVIGSSADDRPDGYCTLHLAVTSKATSDITYYRNYDEDSKHACKMAKKTAGYVVTTLKKTK